MAQELARSILVSCNRALEPVDGLFGRDRGSAKPPLFIVGPPRSGTTLSYQVITQEFRLAYFTALANYLFGASNLMAHVVPPLCGRPKASFESAYGGSVGWCAPAENGNFWFRWLPRDGEQGHYISTAAMSAVHMAQMRAAVNSLALIAGRPFVFKSVYLAMAIGPLAAAFPDARFIHVRRDPFYTCQSLLKARLARPDPREWWSVKPPEYRAWRNLPLAEKIVRQVLAVEEIVARDLRSHAPGRFRELHYEALCADPHAQLSELTEWLAPLGYERYPDTRIPSSFQVSRRVDLPNDMLATLREKLAVMTPTGGL